MKNLLSIIFLFVVISANSQNLNTVLTAGNTTAQSIYQNSYFYTTYAQRLGDLVFEPIGLNNNMIVDNLVYNSPGLNWTYLNAGYGSGLQLYNGGVYLFSYPSASAGSTTTASGYRFGSTLAGDIYFGGKNYNPTTNVGFGFAALNNGSIHFHAPATGTNTLNSLVFDAADSSMKQFPVVGTYYTPAVSSLVNLQSGYTNVSMATYSVVGKRVTASYFLQVTATAANTACSMSISLPSGCSTFNTFFISQMAPVVIKNATGDLTTGLATISYAAGSTIKVEWKSVNTNTVNGGFEISWLIP